MGWAKYYEDNVSIYVGRMAVREERKIYEPVNSCKVVNHAVQEKKTGEMETVIRDSKLNGRRGLELSFSKGIDDSNIRKLQMNGWWWSKVNACWCNMDTKGNRKYAERFTSYAGMRLAVVAEM